KYYEYDNIMGGHGLPGNNEKFPGNEFVDVSHTFPMPCQYGNDDLYEGTRLTNVFGRHLPIQYGQGQNIISACQNVSRCQSLLESSTSLLAIADGSSNDLVITDPKIHNAIEADALLDDARLMRSNRGQNRKQAVLEQLKTFASDPDKAFGCRSVGDIYGIFDRCCELTDEDLNTYQTEIRNFFKVLIKKIRHKDFIERESTPRVQLHKELDAMGYNRKRLAGNVTLQCIISRKLDTAYKKYQNTLESNEKGEKQAIKIAKARTRVKFWRGKLEGDLNGNRYKGAGAGVNGAMFFRSLEESGTKCAFDNELITEAFLGVFKPHPDTVSDLASAGDYKVHIVEKLVKANFGMDAWLNSTQNDPDRRVHNEWLMYKLVSLLRYVQYSKMDQPGYNRVVFPTTILVKNFNCPEKRKASFCEFISGFDEASKHGLTKNGTSKSGKISNRLNVKMSNDKRPKTTDWTDHELTLFQIGVTVDVQTMNLDCHEGNWMVKYDKEGDLVGVFQFDMDKAAIAYNHNGGIENHNKWKDLGMAEKPFTEDYKKFMKTVVARLDPDDPNSAYNLFRDKARTIQKKDDSVKAIWSEEQHKLMMQRRQLFKMIGDGRITTPKALGGYKTEKDFIPVQKELDLQQQSQ
ncbi:MAG: hypothetical protein K940chlam9_01604, partial [Chlamydiae bacterium]|nr:hypothetical protein [Chlamydiota bacterium]